MEGIATMVATYPDNFGEYIVQRVLGAGAYTHSTKTAAGAMLGKALTVALTENALEFSEQKIEKMGDDELLLALRSSSNKISSLLAARIWNRDIYKPVYRAQILPPEERTPQQYEQRRNLLNEKGLFDPGKRSQLEQEFAKRAKISFEDVIIYVSKSAPGAQRVNRYVETEKGGGKYRDEIYTPHQEIFRDHLALWQMQVFVHSHLPTEKRDLIADIAQNEFHRSNDIQSPRKQLSLRF